MLVYQTVIGWRLASRCILPAQHKSWGASSQFSEQPIWHRPGSCDCFKPAPIFHFSNKQTLRPATVVITWRIKTHYIIYQCIFHSFWLTIYICLITDEPAAFPEVPSIHIPPSQHRGLRCLRVAWGSSSYPPRYPAWHVARPRCPWSSPSWNPRKSHQRKWWKGAMG